MATRKPRGGKPPPPRPGRKSPGNKTPKPASPKAPNLRPYFTTKDGRRIWAEDYGYSAWPIGR